MLAQSVLAFDETAAASAPHLKQQVKLKLRRPLEVPNRIPKEVACIGKGQIEKVDSLAPLALYQLTHWFIVYSTS